MFSVLQLTPSQDMKPNDRCKVSIKMLGENQPLKLINQNIIYMFNI